MQTLKQRGCCVLYFKLVQSYNVAECSLYTIFHLLCTLQEAYDRSKEIVIRTISSKLESLFEVQETKTEEMEDASRGYGLLLHAFSLRRKEIRAHHSEAIKTEVRDTRVIRNTDIYRLRRSAWESLSVRTRVG